MRQKEPGPGVPALRRVLNLLRRRPAVCGQRELASAGAQDPASPGQEHEHEIRALFAVASRPEVVSLAGGMPNLAALPLQSLASEVAELVDVDGMTALQYGSGQGTEELRRLVKAVADKTARFEQEWVKMVDDKGLDGKAILAEYRAEVKKLTEGK